MAALSAGGQAVNQSQAQNRANTSQIQNIQQQQQLESQAAAQSGALTRAIAKDSTQPIAQAATSKYVQQLRDNQSASNPNQSALAPVVGADSRYNTDVANSRSNVQSFGNTNASEMGNIDAATRLRQNEGLGMSTLGTGLNTLGAQSYATNFINQLRSQTGGQADPWVSLFSGMLGQGANAYSKNATPPATVASASPAASFQVGGWQNTAPGSQLA